MFQPCIAEEYSQDTVREVFFGISNLCHEIEIENGNEDMRVYHYNLSKAITCLCILNDTFQSSRDEIIALINQLFVIAEDIRRKIRGNSNGSNHAVFQTTKTFLIGDGLGRPKVDISQDTLVHFRSLGFKWNYIADMFLVSRWTIRRRVVEFGLSDVLGYSTISDDELGRFDSEYRQAHGVMCGRSMVTGYLKSIGTNVQQHRVTQLLLRVDPTGSRIRWSLIIRRRKYHVPAPNSLWHVDSHHSLIRWGFVIHGGTDGFSRMIVFLHCSTNNKADTVSNLFEQALNDFGTPSRIRTDKGGENVRIWERMTELRGENHGSYVAGSSVHNQRIERLWRDVWNYASHEFYCFPGNGRSR